MTGKRIPSNSPSRPRITIGRRGGALWGLPVSIRWCRQSKPFVLDNSDDEVTNASNFHFLFALKGINYAKFEFDIALDKAPTKEMEHIDFQYSVKFSEKFSNGLYEGLKNYHYSDITESPMYDNLFYPWGINDIMGLDSRNLKRHESLENDPETNEPNMAAFKVNAYSVPVGYSLSVTLTSVTIRYSA